MRSKCPKNPIIAQLNINSVRNKFCELKELITTSSLDIVVISETKIDYTFPTSQFQIPGYKTPYREDRNANGGGLLVYVKNSITSKRINNLEDSQIENICLEINLKHQKWFLVATYNPPNSSNECFQNSIIKIVDKASLNYENFVIIGDLNLTPDNLHLKTICSTLSLSNLIKEPTCFKPNCNPSSIDAILTNHKNQFKYSKAVETSMSDYHKMIVTAWKSHIPKHHAKFIYYRDFKNFSEDSFLQHLQQAPFQLCTDSNSGEDSFNVFEKIFCSAVNAHAPLKKRLVRANNKPLTAAHRKAIKLRTRLKNKYNRNSTPSNFEKYKKQRNHCANFRQRCKSDYFRNICQNGTLDSKSFWKKLKPYLFGKNHGDSDICLSENDSLITDPKDIAKIMNKHFVSIGKTTDQINTNQDSNLSLHQIVKMFEKHDSIISIKNNLKYKIPFEFQPISRKTVKEIILNLDHKKACGHDMINAKFLKLSVDIIVGPLVNILNKCILQGTFPSLMKKAIVSPVYKKKDPFNKENYRPISVLTALSKVFEKTIELQLSPFLNRNFSNFLCAYRKHFSSQHALIRLLEEWKTGLEANKHTAAVLMDLSKAFDSLPINLLIAKLDAYGVGINSIKLLKSYLTDRKQMVKVNGYFSSWEPLNQGVPQGSILGPLLFNLFINDIFLFIQEGSLCNFADDNTISISAENVNELHRLVQLNTNKCIEWFNSNHMTANPSKFQSLIVGKNGNHIKEFQINNDFKINVSSEVTLLGIQIDEQLRFDSHVDKICKKAAMQLNAIKRLARFMGSKERQVIVNSFILCHFNYCPLIWIFCSNASQKKLEKVNERALRLALSDYTSSYDNLLVKAKSTTIHIHSIRLLALEVYKTLHNLNPVFMKDYFLPKSTSYDLRRNDVLFVPKVKTTNYGIRSISFLGPKIWNSLPNEIKLSKNANQFKILIKDWYFENKCTCNACSQ